MVPDPGALKRGIELFNRREFYESHEVLEDVWRPAAGSDRLFLQALIHFAVSFYHHENGNAVGAQRQMRKGLRKLAGYLPEFQGVDTLSLLREGQACLDLMRNSGSQLPAPKIRCRDC